MADRQHYTYGLHAAEAILTHRVSEVAGAFILDGELRGRLEEIVARLAAAGVRIRRMRRDELDRLVQGGVHQGIVLDVPPPKEQGLPELEALVESRLETVRLLVLDQVEDPRNLGACMRTADAAGIDAVVVPRARSAKLSSAALKAATGAAETVPLIVVPNLARTLRWLRDTGVRLVGADERGTGDYFDTALGAPIAVILGAEGRGLRRLTREACDDLVRIPMRGAVSSLNVSVAAGVLLYEMLRQRAAGN